MLALGVGLGLLVLLVVDALATTLAVSSGAGPVTARWLGLAWRVLLRCHRRDRESAWLTYAGTLLLTATVLSWVLWLWAAWFLVLLGSGAVVDDATGAPASTLDVAYTAGFTIFTLGTGDFSMSEPPWRVAMAAASFSGLFPPDLGPLREAGVPLLDGAVVADRYGREGERRADLHALVCSDGWSWRAVAPGGS